MFTNLVGAKTAMEILHDLLKNSAFWVAVTAFLGLVGTIFTLTILRKKDFKAEAIELPGWGGKPIKIRFNNPVEDAELFKKSYTTHQKQAELIALVSLEKDAAVARREAFFDKALRDAEGRVTNLISEIHTAIEANFTLALDFLYSFDAFVQTELFKKIRATLKDNHLTSRAPSSKEYSDFMHERSLTLTNIVIKLYADQWPNPPNGSPVEASTTGHPTGYQVRKLLMVEKLKDQVEMHFQAILAGFVDLSFKREAEERDRLNDMRVALIEQFGLEEQGARSILETIVPGLRYSTLAEKD